jgi:hypothetical protein
MRVRKTDESGARSSDGGRTSSRHVSASVSPREAIRDDGDVTDDDFPDWQFDIRERSAGGYEGTGTHVSGASVGAVGEDADDLLARLRQAARDLLGT